MTSVTQPTMAQQSAVDRVFGSSYSDYFVPEARVAKPAMSQTHYTYSLAPDACVESKTDPTTAYIDPCLTMCLSVGQREAVIKTGDESLIALMNIGDHAEKTGNLKVEGDNHRLVQERLVSDHNIKLTDKDSNYAFNYNCAIVHNGDAAEYATTHKMSFDEIFMPNPDKPGHFLVRPEINKQVKQFNIECVKKIQTDEQKNAQQITSSTQHQMFARSTEMMTFEASIRHLSCDQLLDCIKHNLELQRQCLVK